MCVDSVFQTQIQSVRRLKAQKKLGEFLDLKVEKGVVRDKVEEEGVSQIVLGTNRSWVVITVLLT